jgi:regulator of nucleoside diphosphate kinase
MAERDIYITDKDMDRLRELLRTTKDPDGRERPYLESLRVELDRAQIVPPESIDAGVVTMNSKVRVRDVAAPRGRTIITLVYPERADLESNQVSVLAPLGAAMLGCRAGERVAFDVPSGVRTCEIEEVLYQPEAAGDVHL